MKTVDIVTIIGNLSIASSLIVAVTVGLVQARTAAKDRKERLTLETLHHYHSREFPALLIFVNSARVPKFVEDFWKLSDEEKTKTAPVFPGDGGAGTTGGREVYQYGPDRQKPGIGRDCSLRLFAIICCFLEEPLLLYYV